MKPNILYWTYLGLGYLLLDNILEMWGYFREVGNDTDALYVPVIIVATIVAIIGLVKRVAWAKIVAFVAIGVDIFLTLGLTIYLVVVGLIDNAGEVAQLLVSSLTFSIPLLFLAYKLYTSEPLKIYLSKPQLSSR